MTPDVGGGTMLDVDVPKFLPFDDRIKDCVDDEMEKSVINPPVLSSSSPLVHDDNVIGSPF